MIFQCGSTVSRPPQFQNWSVEAWKNFSSPGWMERADDPANRSCYIKNYDYEQVTEDHKLTTKKDILSDKFVREGPIFHF